MALVFWMLNVLSNLKVGVTRSTLTCWFFPEKWCKKVQYSKFSRTAGIPNSYLGFVLSCEIILLTLFTMFTSMPFWPVATLVTIGFLFAMYFTIIQAFVLKAFYVYCIISAVNFTVMFISVLYYSRLF